MTDLPIEHPSGRVHPDPNPFPRFRLWRWWPRAR